MIDGELSTIDGRPALRFQRDLGHSVERVWRAVSVPAELAQWFPAAVDWVPAVGESIQTAGMTGIITEVDPPHRLAWTFAGDLYSFDLSEHRGGCRLVFVHVFADRSAAAQFAAGWEAYLTRLEPLLDGTPLSEQDAHQGWDEVRDRYAARWGLDQPAG